MTFAHLTLPYTSYKPTFSLKKAIAAILLCTTPQDRILYYLKNHLKYRSAVQIVLLKQSSQVSKGINV